MGKDVLGEIRQKLECRVGEQIKLKANKGRRKTFEKEGVLESTYPSIFVIRVDESNYYQRFTFSYADVLTETVELSFYNDNMVFAAEIK